MVPTKASFGIRVMPVFDMPTKMAISASIAHDHSFCMYAEKSNILLLCLISKLFYDFFDSLSILGLWLVSCIAQRDDHGRFFVGR